jgi:SAM-dependent methyltransferase
VSDEHERVAGGQSFDAAAPRYQRARPEYPAELLDALIELAGVAPGAHLLEVGCATGKATLPLARRGFRITAIELGAAMSAAARENLAEFPDVDVVHSSFERWVPPAGRQFDLVFAATSWHWVDPDLRYRKAAQLLAPGSCLAFWTASHVFPEGGDPFFREIQDVYDELGDSLPPDATWPTADEMADSKEEIEASGLFDVVAIRRFGWVLDYDADAYIDLLETFSSSLTKSPAERNFLYAKIRERLAARSDPVLHRGWGAALHVARRR